VANGPNIFQMLLVLFNVFTDDVPTAKSTAYDATRVHSSNISASIAVRPSVFYNVNVVRGQRKFRPISSCREGLCCIRFMCLCLQNYSHIFVLVEWEH